MKLLNFLDLCDVRQNNIRNFGTEITGVTSRSENVKNGYAFVCVEGTKNDGHSFAEKAAERGAALLVVSKITDSIVKSGLPYLEVDNTRKVLSLFSARINGDPQKYLRIDAVTGTNGKTSNVRLISSVYEKAGIRTEQIGTLTGQMTTPDAEELYPILKRTFDKGVKSVVMEASSHSLALDKLAAISFESAIFTNLTPEHLDFHGEMNEYASAKAKLFEKAEKSIINIDDGYSGLVSGKVKNRKYTYSLKDKNADFYAFDILSNKNGIEYKVKFPCGMCQIKSRLCGLHNVYNTLSAFSLCFLNGIKPQTICEAIEKTEVIPGRLEKVDTHGLGFDVYIDYAHTPDALSNVLNCIRSFREDGQKLTVLFGCGGDRDKSKRRVMGSIASRLADFVIVTSDNNRSENRTDIINEILKGIDKERPYKVIEDRKSAIEYAVKNAEKGEIILLAGKGHEEYEIQGDKKTYFSEKETVEKAIQNK